ncbi:MAG: hypothetical protein QME74_07490 [Candidatus Edwardsbacteria bacterium]|nr:hypothetical protein [Candidatus Edwardsbacteria bacterium]
MKIIVSHDVDHLTVWEHWKDLIAVKQAGRNLIELAVGRISIAEVLLRCANMACNRWQNIEELMEYDISRKVPSTFFVGVANGKGLSYSPAQAAKWIERIKKQGFDVGVHGINYDDAIVVKQEHDRFADIYRSNDFGIRMHYLRRTEQTMELLSQAGYSYDCSEPGMIRPRLVGRMWEFPLQLMDGWVLCEGTRWQNRDLEQAKAATIGIIDQAARADLPYCSLLFHDRYFDDSFLSWKQWYMWVIDHLCVQGYSFCDYRTAVSELGGGN